MCVKLRKDSVLDNDVVDTEDATYIFVSAKFSLRDVMFYKSRMLYSPMRTVVNRYNTPNVVLAA